ncbi:tripartite tricarboxylate transporter TctB family protein (plasmid) [Photobacterium sp. GJ3]|uniref:tripartite tricarboxylate transporter TctB family protein n=1 Tax=Photobacterium sp. GJ3 TaxID=2829502 RepID=UPI001B8B5F94|nr:tripartite tricarboxylate transporter TctB family protein [Photobacterium sp. GJ3]
MNEQRNELVIGIIFLILSLLVIFFIIPVWVETPAYLTNSAVGPSFWPYTITSVCCVISFSMILTNIKQISKLRININKGKSLKLIFIFTLFILYYELISILGFIISTIFLSLALIMMSNPGPASTTSVLKAFGVSALFTLLIYFIFTNIAQTQFPTGFLGV